MIGFTYSIKEKDDFDFIQKLCLEKGLDVRDTKELSHATIFGDLKDRNDIIRFAMDNDMTELLFWMASVVKYRTPTIDCKNYISKDYMKIRESIVEAVNELINDGKETRRAVIMFPKWHCFSSVQFLYNREKLGYDIVDCICTMRSCNVQKNLASDMLLCYLMTSEVDDMYRTKINESDVSETKFRVIMNIGSLHCFVTKKERSDFYE